MKIERTIKDQIISSFFQGKVIIVYGPRQVGKTTLIKDILELYPNSIYLNADRINHFDQIANLSIESFQLYFGQFEVIALDEVQQVPNIGKILKLIVDHFPNKQIIVTGSSSFELGQSVVEPLTGRNYTFQLYPIALCELQKSYSWLDIDALLEQYMIYGTYPEVLQLTGSSKIDRLQSITSDYLFKDILKFEGIKSSGLLKKLLQLLALQIGQEVSINELGQQLGVSNVTINKYIDILEYAFIIYKLPSYATNKRKELSKSMKIYFWDLGIRNSLINNYNELGLRQDAGSLRENFCINERLKFNSYNKKYCNSYFWRTYQQQEVDYIEESGGSLYAFEIKLNPKKIPTFDHFLLKYPQATVGIINPKSYHGFVAVL